jgi:hypothetical protein
MITKRDITQQRGKKEGIYVASFEGSVCANRKKKCLILDRITLSRGLRAIMKLFISRSAVYLGCGRGGWSDNEKITQMNRIKRAQQTT